MTMLPVKRKKSHSSATILIDDIMECFTCPICFDDISRGHMTPCGHNFCEKCIKECLNRKHICPLCSAEATEEQLIRNHHLDGVISKLHQVRESAAQEYVEKLMSNTLELFHKEAPHASQGPIAQIFTKATAQTLVKFENYYQDMVRDCSRNQLRLQDELRQQLIALIPLLSRINEALKKKLQSKIMEHNNQEKGNEHNNEEPGAISDDKENEIEAIEKQEGEKHKEGIPSLSSQLEEMFLGMFDIEGVNDSFIEENGNSDSKKDSGVSKNNKLTDHMYKHIDEFEKFVKSNCDQLMLTTNTLNEISSKLAIFKSQMSAIQERFERSCKLLFDSYEQYMQNVAPSPFLLPLSATIRLRGRRQFWDVPLKPTDQIGIVIDIVGKKFEELGDPIEKWQENEKSLGIIRPLADRKKEQPMEIIKDLNRCVREFDLRPGANIHLLTTFVLKSETPRPCFTFTYAKDTGQKCDYFRCKTCNFNWICQPCAIQCHKDHELVAFMKDHMPSYACCYCVKKKTCKIDNIKSKGLEE